MLHQPEDIPIEFTEWGRVAKDCVTSGHGKEQRRTPPFRFAVAVGEGKVAASVVVLGWKITDVYHRIRVGQHIRNNEGVIYAVHRLFDEHECARRAGFHHARHPVIDAIFAGGPAQPGV